LSVDLLSVDSLKGAVLSLTRVLRGWSLVVIVLTGALWLSAARPLAAEDEEPRPIKIAELERSEPVDFQKEVLPLLKKSCLACHSKSEAQSDLVLETPEAILKGGALGPAVVPQKSAESLLLKAASHQEEPMMPPADNDVGAPDLTPEELGLIKLWIDAGAKGSAVMAEEVQWQPLPPGVNPIYAVAVTPDGQFVACGRANQIFIYHVPSGALVCRLNDPLLQAESPDKKPGRAHLDIVQSLAFSPDGYTLASGGYRVVKLWQRPRNVARQELPSAEAALTAVAVSPDGAWIATGSAEPKIRLWSTAEGKVTAELSGAMGEVTGLKFSPDGGTLYASDRGGSVQVFRREDGHLLARIDVPTPLNALTVSGNTLLVAGEDHLIRGWNLPLESGRTVPGTVGQVTTAAISPDRQWLASASAEGQVELFNLSEGRVAHGLTAHPGGVRAMSFRGDSAQLATAGQDGQVSVWETASGKPLASVALGSGVERVALLPEGNAVVVGMADGSAVVSEFKAVENRPLLAAGEAPAQRIVVSPDATRLAAITTIEGKPAVILRDATSGSVLHTLQGHEAPITALAFSQQGTRLAIGSADHTVSVWNLADGKMLCRFKGHAAPIRCVAFHSGVAQVVSGAEDGSVQLWNAADGGALKTFAGPEAAVLSVMALAGGKEILTISADQKVRTFDVVEGNQVTSHPLGGVPTATAMAPSGNQLAVATPRGVQILDRTGNVVATCTTGGDFASLRFSRDGARLVGRQSSGRATIWDVSSGGLLANLAADASLAAAPLAADASDFVVGQPDGALVIQAPLPLRQVAPALATAAGETPATETAATETQPEASQQSAARPDGTIAAMLLSPDARTLYVAAGHGASAYSVADGKLRYRLEAGAAVRHAALSPDGKLLAVGLESGSARLFNAADGQSGSEHVLQTSAGPVARVSFTAEGGRLLVAARSGEILTYQISDGRAVQTLRQLPDLVLCMGSLPGDAPAVVAVGRDGTLRMWPTPAVRLAVGHGGAVTALDVVLPEGKQIVSGSADGTVRIWNVADGKQVRQLDHGAAVTAVAMRPDGQQVASTGASGVTRIWNMADGKPLHEIQGDHLELRSLARLDYLAGITQARAEAATKEQGEATKNSEEKTAEAAKAAEALKPLVKAAAEATTVAEATTQEKAAVDKLVADTAAGLKAATEAKTAADKTAAETVQLANAAAATAADLKPAVEAQAASQQAADASLAAVKVAASKIKDDKQLAAVLEQAQKLATETAQAADQLATAFAAKEKLAADAMAAAEAAKQAAEAALKMMTDADTAAKAAVEKQKATDASLKTAQEAAKKATDAKNAGEKAASDAQTEVVLATQRLERATASVEQTSQHQQQVTSQRDEVKKSADEQVNPQTALAYSPNGRQLAIGGADHRVRLYDANTATGSDIITAHQGPIRAVAFEGDGALASASADKAATIWELYPAWTLSGRIGPPSRESTDVAESQLVDRVTALAFSPDSKVLATGGGEPSRSGELKLWDVAQRTLLREIVDAHSDTVFGVDFSYDGRYLASCGADKFVKVFRLSDGAFLKAFEGHTHHVLDVAWRTDGNSLASSGADNVIKVWNFETGEQSRTIGGFGKQVTSIHYIGTTQYTLTSCGDQQIRMHDTDNGKVVRPYGGGTDFMYSSDATFDGSVVAGGGQDSVLRIWNGTDGKPDKSFDPPQQADK
jgi:WD40 repeat protein